MGVKDFISDDLEKYSEKSYEARRFLPPYDGPDAPQGKQLFLDQELNDFYHKTFQYYDADQSGTISDYAEMRKLTINLSWSLVGSSRLKGSRVHDIDNKLDYFKDPYLNRNPMYLPVYVVWFSRHIMDPYYEFETPDDDEDDSDSDEEISLRKKDIKMLYHWESTEQEIEPRRAPTPEAAPENPKNLAHAKVFQAPMPPPPPPPRSPSIGSPANLSNPGAQSPKMLVPSASYWDCSPECGGPAMELNEHNLRTLEMESNHGPQSRPAPAPTSKEEADAPRITTAPKQPAGPPPPLEEPPLPPGWKEYWSSEKQRAYYHNNETKQTVWEQPGPDGTVHHDPEQNRSSVPAATQESRLPDAFTGRRKPGGSCEGCELGKMELASPCTTQ